MSVLIRKPRSYAEIYNDLDVDAVNLFRVLRSNRAHELVNALRLTPFARDEFVEAYSDDLNPVERARRLVIRSFMGFGSNGHNKVTGFRANSNRPGTTPAHDWVNYPDALQKIVERLSGVTIENRDALDVMRQHDAPMTLHYVDPPYVMASRSDAGDDYAHELTDDDHAKMLDTLRSLTGMVVLSGYAHPLYDETLKGWRRETRASLADGAKKRVEVLWMNDAAASQGSLLTAMEAA